MDRRVSLSRSIINGFDSLYKDSKKVKKISEDSEIGVKEKVKLIKDILPGEPLSYIADALNISLSTLKRRIK
jgi:DNA invertase Pin-like site-specific DNA recombinase